MGALRTIQHAGIEIREWDLSDYVSTVGGTTSLVIGFSPQGQSAVPVIPTSTASVKSYFGTPKTEAERYFYYACKKVFDNGGNLVAARIPYNNNAQYLTPSVTYDIETWQTTHTNTFDPAYSVEEDTDVGTVTIAPSAVVTFRDGNKKKTASVKSFSVYFGDDKEPTEITALSKYYKIVGSADTDNESLKGDFDFYVDNLVVNGKNSGTYQFVSDGSTWKLNGDVVQNEKWADYGIVWKSGTPTIPSAVTTITVNVRREAENVDCTPKKFYLISLTEAAKEAGKTTVDADVLANVGYFNVTAYKDDAFYYLTRALSAEKPEDKIVLDGCVYDPVKKAGVNYPVLAVVEQYGTTENTKCVGVKGYYNGTDGFAVYPNCISADFFKYELTTNGENALENAGIEKIDGKYTPEQIVENVRFLNKSEYFKVTKCDYVGKISKRAVSLGSSFNGAPISADVTVGYDISKNLAIPALPEGAEFNPDSYPSIIAADPFEDGNYRYVASTIPGLNSYAYDSKDFYEFVSPFTTISSVAIAGSQNYNWIHWHIAPTSADTDSPYTSAYIDNSLMMSALAGFELSAVPDGISNIENLVTIKPNDDRFGFIPLSTFQNYRDGAEKPADNKIVICNITEKQYGADDYNNAGMECLGIMPILIGGLQAVPKQQIVQLPPDTANGRIFNAVESAVRGNLYSINVPESDGITIKYGELNNDGFYKDVANKDAFAPYDSTISNDALGYVPTIQLNQELKPDGMQKNAVTLVVCELQTSSSFDNKVYVNVLETFTGSLDKNAVDAKNKSVFIDNIVNSEDSGSSYVRMFTNFDYASMFKNYFKKNESTETYIGEQTTDNTATIVVPASIGSNLWFTKDKEAMSLGFVSEQTKKYISYSTIAATIESVFDTLSNVDETTIDVVVDAGLSTIANRIKRISDENPDVLKSEFETFYEKINNVDAIAGWKSICAKYITFCSSTRKDCMAVVDAPRNLSVYNDVKLVKNPKYSIDFDILPSLTYLAGLNSSYCAQYANWISYVDDFSGKTIWLPPSIMANSSIIFTDYNAQYFDAPAGTKRGLVRDGIDVSFNPNAKQQDILYGKSWNYFINTTSDGIVLWGQKTSQTRTSAFDRVNVRRLFLRLERLTRNAMKTFVFEGNTEKLRNRVVDMLTPIYENCKTNGGLYDYQIICDTRNNTSTSIDNNELRVAILLKPTKTAEFIILDFFALSTGMDFAEAYSYL